MDKSTYMTLYAFEINQCDIKLDTRRNLIDQKEARLITSDICRI